MIEVVEISRNFGRFQAVNNISFRVQGRSAGFWAQTAQVNPQP